MCLNNFMLIGLYCSTLCSDLLLMPKVQFEWYCDIVDEYPHKIAPAVPVGRQAFKIGTIIKTT